MHAPAKINLGLFVRDRRADGYHRLESLFLPLALGDEVGLHPAAAGSGLRFELAGAFDGVPADEGNLVSRAGLAFQAEIGRPIDATLRLEKRIPAAAGLGGGSSDAGTALRLLSDHHPGAIAPDRLEVLALGLGADVPFFLDPRPCWVSGIGEIRTPVAGFPELPLLLLHPGIPLATAEVYAEYDAHELALTPDRATPTLGDLRGPAGGFDLERLEAVLRNDLEPAAVRRCPPIRDAIEALRRAGARVASMSGSGPTVFGVFESEEARDEAMREIAPEPPVRGIPTRTQASPATSTGA